MIRLPPNANDEQILEVARNWIELLAADKYDEALNIFRSTDYAGDWTPELLKTVISYYGSLEPYNSGEIFKVSSLTKEISGKPYQFRVEWFEFDEQRSSDFLGSVLFDLPLNDEWSDLTAIFDIFDGSGGLVFELDIIHVL